MGLESNTTGQVPNERYLIDIIKYIRIEDPNLNKGDLALGLVCSTLARVFRRIDIKNGSVLPKKGPALVVMTPHTSLWDPPLVYYAVGTQAERVPRMIAANYLIDPNLPQDPNELARTGKKPHSKPMRHVLSYITNIGHPISFNRSDEGKEATEEIDQTIDSGRIVAVALQETRKKAWEPNPARLGAARIAIRHPDLPIIPMAIIGKRFFGLGVRFGNQFTATEVVEGQHLDISNRRALVAVHNHIISATADMLPEQVAKNLQARS